MRKTVSLVLFIILVASSLLGGCARVDKPSNDLSYLKFNNPAEVDNSKLPVTPVNQLHTTTAGTPPSINVDEYRLAIDGLVTNPLSLAYKDLLNYPKITKKVLLICPGVFVDNAVWTGVSLKMLLDQAGVKPEASLVVFYGEDGYVNTIHYADVKADNVFLAYWVNGQALPAKNGYPIRAVMVGQFGSLWVKWVNHIELKIVY